MYQNLKKSQKYRVLRSSAKRIQTWIEFACRIQAILLHLLHWLRFRLNQLHVRECFMNVVLTVRLCVRCFVLSNWYEGIVKVEKRGRLLGTIFGDILCKFRVRLMMFAHNIGRCLECNIYFDCPQALGGHKTNSRDHQRRVEAMLHGDSSLLPSMPRLSSQVYSFEEVRLSWLWVLTRS